MRGERADLASPVKATACVQSRCLLIPLCDPCSNPVDTVAACPLDDVLHELAPQRTLPTIGMNPHGNQLDEWAVPNLVEIAANHSYPFVPVFDHKDDALVASSIPGGEGLPMFIGCRLF